jgi:DNA-nicking Smr family endonuclease
MMSIISDSEKDKRLFQSTVGKVVPVKSDKVVSRPAFKRLPLRKKEESENIPLERNFSNPYSTLVEGDTVLGFARAGVQEKQLRHLRQGLLPIEAECDLHRLTQEEAEDVLASFLSQCFYERHYRVIRIIHGKGHRSGTRGPLLKNLVNQRLREYPAVLAFCSAPSVAGGTGAVLALLKAMTK